MEYYVRSWTPWYRRDVSKLEAIQWSAIKMAKVLKHMAYEAEETGFSLEKTLRKDLIARFLLPKREL